jgi:hypothetical protein
MFYFLSWERNTSHVGHRDNLKRNILYELERVVRSVYIHFYMYAGCNGNNCVCTWVVVGTIVYIHIRYSR